MSNNADESCSELGNRSFVILHSPSAATELIPNQADNDDQLIELWLHGRPVTTVKAYLTDISKMRCHINKPLRSITLGDLQGFMDSLRLKPSSVKRKVNAVKSLFAFGQKLGYLRFDVGRALKVQSFRDELAERILTTDEVHRLLDIERNPRNRAIMFLFYGSGIRVSELASLKWKHVAPRESSGQITVFGKGGKTRWILIPQQTWDALLKIKKAASDEEPVFRSRKKGHLHPSQVWRIVKKAAKKAGLKDNVSCHWLRHSHASISLHNGSPIHLVQATLGHSSIATTGRYLHARPTDSSGNYLGMD
jgi:site-specific recombinase XerD